MSWKQLRRELRVRALLLALPLLRALPLAPARAVGAAIGWLAYWVVPRERRRALEHLAIAFPDWPRPRRARVARAAFANLGRCAAEIALVHKVDLLRDVQLRAEDEALLRAAQAEGRGVILVACHAGNWELFARRIAATGLPSATVAREANDPRLTRLLEATRAGAGVRVFWRGGGTAQTRELVRFLRSGGMLGILIDQDTRVPGVFVPFFNRPAFTPRAAGDLAERYGCAVLFGCAHRVGPGRHEVVLRRLQASGSEAITAAATRAIEDEVRKRPDEWVWMHRRWKTQAP